MSIYSELSDGFSVRVSVALMNTMTKRNLEEERVYSIL